MLDCRGNSRTDLIPREPMSVSGSPEPESKGANHLDDHRYERCGNRTKSSSSRISSCLFACHCYSDRHLCQTHGILRQIRLDPKGRLESKVTTPRGYTLDAPVHDGPHLHHPAAKNKIEVDHFAIPKVTSFKSAFRRALCRDTFIPIEPRDTPGNEPTDPSTTKS